MCNKDCEKCLQGSGKILTLEDYTKYRAQTPIVNLIVNLTDNCNLRCPYCFTCHNVRDSSMEVLQQTVRFLIQEEERTGVRQPKSIAFFGGEPMLKYDDLLVPFVRWVEDTGLKKEYGFNFSITTNGTLLTPERIKWFFGHDVSILLSIDGDKQTQDNQRPAVGGKSSFDMIEPNIPTLLRYFPEVTFRSTVEPWNVDKVLQNYLYARKMGFHHYFITPNVYSEWNEENANTLMMQLMAATGVMYNDIKKGGMVTWMDFFIDDLKKTAAMKNSTIDDTTRNISRCGLGTVSAGIAVDGTINGCQEHNTYQNQDLFEIGNIFDGIDPEKHLNLIRAYQKYDRPISEREECQECPVKEKCITNFCPSANLGKEGDILSMPFINCKWKQFFYQYCQDFLEKVKKDNDFNVVTALMN